MRSTRDEAATGRALVMPWLIGFLVFSLFPIATSLYLSFTEYDLFSAPEWVGLENYQELFDLSAARLESTEQRSSDALPPRHDEIIRVQVGDGGFVLGAREEDFWRSMRLTIVYAVLTVPLGLVGALAVALMLNQRVRYLGFWRVLFYLPAVLPAVATALLWRWMFSQSGIVNAIFSPVFTLLGNPRPSWLTDSSLSIPLLSLLACGVSSAQIL
jgi:multiple sugar transport system permease protein